MSDTVSTGLQIDWRAVGIIVSLATAVIGGMLSLVYKLIVANFGSQVKLFDARVEGIAKRFEDSVEHNAQIDRDRIDRLVGALETETKKREALEKDFRSLLADLPREFIQRIEWVREFNKVDAKLDAIWEALSTTREKVAQKEKH